MKTYFLGDLHGNLDALEACLAHMDRVNPDEALCLGDIVGWLPFGDRTLLRMRALELPTVCGNHDLLVSGCFTDHPAQGDRMQASAYNMGLLSRVDGAFEYLTGLPATIEREGLLVTHHSPFHLPEPGTPPSIRNFGYLDEASLAESLSAWQDHPAQLIVTGHDHVPAVYELPDLDRKPAMSDVIAHRPGAGDLVLSLNPRSRYWIKAGSVGGPYRDGVPVANPVLYDDGAGTLTLFRLSYPTGRLKRELAEHRFVRNLPTLRRYVDLLGD